MMSTAFSIIAGSPLRRGRYDIVRAAARCAYVPMPMETSFGISTTTGPGRPLRATWNASWTTRAQSVHVLDQVVVLGARPGNPGGVALLKGIVADQVRGHLARQADDGNAVHQGIRQTGDRIGRAGPGRHQYHAHLSRRARVTLGGVNGARLLAHQDVADRVLLEELVVNRQDGAAGIPEYDFDSLVDQGLEKNLRSVQLLIRHRDRSRELRPGPRKHAETRENPCACGRSMGPRRTEPSRSAMPGQQELPNK